MGSITRMAPCKTIILIIKTYEWSMGQWCRKQNIFSGACRIISCLKFLNLSSRVSHGKVNKVIWLCWGYRFWFLLIFWVQWIHEKGTFVPNSSVFIFLMLCALYRMICKNTKSFFGKNSLNVSNVKLFSNFSLQRFWLLCLFWWE